MLWWHVRFPLNEHAIWIKPYMVELESAQDRGVTVCQYMYLESVQYTTIHA